MRRLALLLVLLVTAACGPTTAPLLRAEYREGGETRTLLIAVDGTASIDGVVLSPLEGEALVELTLLVEAIATLPAPVGADPDDGITRRLTIGETTIEVQGMPAAPEPYRVLFTRLDALFASR
jgi:hypothetical protein